MRRIRNLFPLILALMVIIVMPVFAFAEDAADTELSYDPQDSSVPYIEEPLREGGNGIPIIYIMVDEADFKRVWEDGAHREEAQGLLQIKIPEGASGTGTDELAMTIRGRGNSTWKGPKRPFKIKLDEKADLLGMGSNKHWVLLANAFDDTLLRNRVIEYIGTRMGLEFTMESRPVDLVVNGVYRGSYTLCEHVRVAKTRVNIDEIDPNATSGSEITGGYFLEMNPGDGDEYSTYMTGKQVFLGIDTPDFSEYGDDQTAGKEAQSKYIFNYIQNLENALFSDDFHDEKGVRYSEYMDLESAAKYWWIQEFAANGDAFETSSTYLYKKRDGKLYWGPLWDFDLSMDSGRNWETVFNNTKKMAWLDHMRENDPQYQKELMEQWNRLDQILDDITKEGGVLDTYADEIRSSWINDAIAYKKLYGEEITEKEAEAEFSEAIENLRRYIDSRRKSINENLQDLYKVNGKVTFVDGEDTVDVRTIRLGSLMREPDFPWMEKEGSEFAGWYTDPELTEPFYRYTSITRDTVLFAKWSEDEPAPEPAVTEFEIRYKLGGGTYEGSSEDIVEKYPVGTEIAIHEAPVRDGYDFLYWEGSKYQPGDKYVVTEDHVLTARWKKQEENGANVTPSDSDDSDTETVSGDEIKTSDNVHLILWMVIALIAAAGIGCMVYIRIKDSRE